MTDPKAKKPYTFYVLWDETTDCLRCCEKSLREITWFLKRFTEEESEKKFKIYKATEVIK